MFCPKCGTENSKNTKFCRKCGNDLGLINDVMSGKLSVSDSKDNRKKASWESALVLLSMSMALFTVAIILAFQPMGRGWWFWLLFGGFSMLAPGIAQIIQLKQEQKNNFQMNSEMNKSLPESENANALPPKQTEFASDFADIKYQTGDLAPASVVEKRTTRKLEMESEGETMTLPKQEM